MAAPALFLVAVVLGNWTRLVALVPVLLVLAVAAYLISMRHLDGTLSGGG